MKISLQYSNCNFSKKNNNCKQINNIKQQFCGKLIKYRIESKYQDDFHVTSQQVLIRKYLKYKNSGLSNVEIASKLFAVPMNEIVQPGFELYIDYVNKVEQDIKRKDKSFNSLIPTIFPKTYYRGIVDLPNGDAITILKNAEVGDIIEPDIGYPFFASKLDYAKGHARYYDGTKSPSTCAIMEVRVPAGVPLSHDITYNSLFGDKNVVFPRGVRYCVVGKEIKDNVLYLKLKYLNSALDR